MGLSKLTGINYDVVRSANPAGFDGLTETLHRALGETNDNINSVKAQLATAVQANDLAKVNTLNQQLNNLEGRRVQLGQSLHTLTQARIAELYRQKDGADAKTKKGINFQIDGLSKRQDALDVQNQAQQDGRDIGALAAAPGVSTDAVGILKGTSTTLQQYNRDSFQPASDTINPVDLTGTSAPAAGPAPRDVNLSGQPEAEAPGPTAAANPAAPQADGLGPNQAALEAQLLGAGPVNGKGKAAAGSAKELSGAGGTPDENAQVNQLLRQAAGGTLPARVKNPQLWTNFIQSTAGLDDSKFSPEAVKAYQQAMGLTPDGIVGQETWSALSTGGKDVRPVANLVGTTWNPISG